MLNSAAAGAFNFTIQGTDGTLTHATPNETLTVGTDVAWSDTGNSTVTVSAGQTANYTFSAVPVGAETFSSAVNLGCSGLPALSTCAFTPASIVAGAGTAPVTLAIRTQAPTSMRGTALRSSWTGKDGRRFGILWVGLMGIVGLGLRQKIRGKPRFYRAVGIGLVLVGLTACGGLASSRGGGGGGTPPGTSQITVTATAVGAAAHGDVVTLIVQ
jgi:hypothetical protein